MRACSGRSSSFGEEKRPHYTYIHIMMLIHERHIGLRESSNRNPGFHCILYIVLWACMLEFL